MSKNKRTRELVCRLGYRSLDIYSSGVRRREGCVSLLVHVTSIEMDIPVKKREVTEKSQWGLTNIESVINKNQV